MSPGGAPRKAVVIGAGITGLSAAWKLAGAGFEVTLIEKDPVIGGLAGTIDWDGWRFDYGPHSFHTNDQKVIDFYKKLLPDRFLERKIKVKLYIFSKLVSYPMWGFDALLALRGFRTAYAGWSFFLARLKAFLFGIAPTEHLDEWIIRRFGRVLYETYFGPYIRRVWRADPHRLSKMIGETKIPLLSIRRLIRREIFRNVDYNPEDLSQWQTFYVRGGVGELSRYFLEGLQRSGRARVLLGEEVTGLRLESGRIVSVETARQRLDTADAVVVSTIPVNLLVQRTAGISDEVRRQADKLEFCSERFLFLRVKRPQVSGYHWTYFSDKRYPFNRVAEFNHDEFEMTPPGHTSLTFEYPCNEDDWEWKATDEELLAKTLPLYSEVFPLRREDILDYRTAYQRYAYPRFVTGIEALLATLWPQLDAVANLHSIGRQGRFCYINVDGATRIGLATADKIIEGGR
jgi:protoporphyrinogen oxidase